MSSSFWAAAAGGFRREEYWVWEAVADGGGDWDRPVAPPPTPGFSTGTYNFVPPCSVQGDGRLASSSCKSKLLGVMPDCGVGWWWIRIEIEL